MYTYSTMLISQHQAHDARSRAQRSSEYIQEATEYDTDV